MDSRTPESCLQWIRDEKKILDSFDYGSCLQGSRNALQGQGRRDRMINSYKAEVESVIENNQNDASHDADAIQDKYSELLSLSAKTLSCSESVLEITKFEEVINDLSHSLDSRANELARASVSISESSDESIPNNDTMLRSSQRCIFAIKNNWNWVSKMMKCMQTHLDNAAAYHQFFNEASECELWMEKSLSRLSRTFQLMQIQGDRESVNNMLKEIKETLTAYLHWQGKVDSLFHRCGDIVPVDLRVEPLSNPKPATALCSYKTENFSIMEGEDIILLENEDPKLWKVRNSDGEIGEVPPVICLLSTADPKAVDLAVRLRLQLLALWTGSVKRLGRQVIWFMCLVLRDWVEEEIKLLKCLPKSQKKGNIESSFLH
ncbi:unnamed protein product [Owenia fusiformis]|uniref:SH3 domain-containing protein n=1 Tax=Owenia fusiformis TaxID=6347 RepID=A0A8S4NK27_OWEFU|nr:unnamed protein product [Owenia fusiformis]